MNTAKLRSKRVIIPSVTAIALLAAGGTVWSATADDGVQGADRDRVGAAAVSAVGGGTAVEVDTSDDPGEAYEVEVRQDDGTEVDVALDEDLAVVAQETDDDSGEDSGDDSGDDADEAGTDTPDADDRPLGDDERASAEEAALDAVGGGTVEQVEAGDGRDEAYEVEVRAEDGTEWDVSLDADFEVLSSTTDD